MPPQALRDAVLPRPLRPPTDGGAIFAIAVAFLLAIGMLALLMMT